MNHFQHNPDLTSAVIYGLGWVYLLMFLMNAAWVRRSYLTDGTCRPGAFFGMNQEIPWSGFWAVYCVMLFLVAITHLTGWSNPPQFTLKMPEILKAPINAASKPEMFFIGSTAIYVLMILLRRWWATTTAGWILLNLSFLYMTLSITDYDFRQIVGKPDNVPIVAMLYIVGFFTWLYFKKSVDNDARKAAGRPLFEQENSEKVLTWPDLVYTELVCMVLVTAVLIAWGIVLQAPLEEAASAAKTPNPSKAPWYFLGLQEMLVYFDPWMAGVVLPSVILVGLMAIPYIDFNKLGNGYYTFNERKFAVSTFLFGFLPLWVAMIVLGTFLRGPNWNFFSPYEFWDTHKLELLNNVNLSQLFWQSLGLPLPAVPKDSTFLGQAGYIVLREWVGLVAVLVYLLVLPNLLAVTVFRKFYIHMGFLRYMVLANLMLFMMSLPIKMVLRWTVNLKYIVAIPEWFFNI